MDNNRDYMDLSKFWDNQFCFDSEDEKNILEKINPDEDWKRLSPSKKLFKAISLLGSCKNVLDYGCGDGWASITIAKSGDCKVKAVDVTSNGINLGKVYRKAFDLDEKIDFEYIEPNWLSKQPSDYYDGFFCSNVLDVIPNDMAIEIIKEAARVVKQDSKVIFSFNYYVEPKTMEQRGAIVKDNNVYLGGVLRLVAYTDDELKSMFSPYFDVVKLDYFSWPGEEKETRRLFILTKKKV